MPEMLDLSSELLEQILLQVEEVEDMLCLASSCSRLATILGQERLWRVLLAKTTGRDECRRVKLVDRMRRITAFLSLVPDCASLSSLLRQTIRERYPASGQGRREQAITASCPSEPEPQAVSGLGLELLAITGRLTVHRVKVKRLSPSLLLCLASLASLQQERIAELEVTGMISCRTEEKGLGLASLLAGCNVWRVE